MASAVEFMPWTPGSPRLSFSRDFVQSEVFNPSSGGGGGGGGGGGVDSMDFDFGMLSLLRSEDPTLAPPTPMLPADELFRNGRILPSCKLVLDQSIQVLNRQQQQQQQQQQQNQELQEENRTPMKSSSSRWRELFRKRSCTAATETEPSCSSRFASAKLKLLFRSSSAGAGRSSPETEPCLGRSASESKASTSSTCCNGNLFSTAPAAAAAAAAPAPLLLPLPQQRHRRRSSRTSSSGSGGGSSTNSTAARGRRDAWRAYNERALSCSSSSGGATLPPNVKVAEVLHMEVCMGQSMVVSKVAKAFKNKSLAGRGA